MHVSKLGLALLVSLPFGIFGSPSQTLASYGGVVTPAPVPGTTLQGYGRPSMDLSTAVGQRYLDRSTTPATEWVRTSTTWDSTSDPTLPPVRALPDLMSGGFFMGVNYAGLDSWFGDGGHVPGVNYSVPMESDFDYLVSRGVQVVRFQFSAAHLFQSGYTGAMDPTYLGLLRQSCGWMAARSMGCILDMHDYAAFRTGPSSETPQIGASGGPSYADFGTAWRTLAAVAKDWPGVIGFDTMNEPKAVPDIAAMQQSAVASIRAAGAKQPIALEGNGYSSAGNWLADGNTALYSVSDPLNKLIIEAHVYPDCDASGTHTLWAVQSTDPSANSEGGTTCAASQAVTLTTGANRLAVFLTSVQAAGKRAWLGEVGAAKDHAWRIAVDNIVQAMQAAGGFVTYWAAGTGYGSYPYTIDPQSGGQQPGGVIDTPMIGNVTKYTGFTAIPYGLAGPTHGAVSTAAAFQPVVHGWLPTAVTITPSDNGAGGVFNPSSVVVAAGFADDTDVPSFAYTPPASARIISISTSNNGGLMDPAPITYGTLPDPIGDAIAASGATVVSEYSLWAPSPQITGTVANLRRGADGASIAVLPAPNKQTPDTVVLGNWIGDGKAYLSQWPNLGNNGLNPVVMADPSAKYPVPSYADQPQVVLNALKSQPGVSFTNNRMQGTADITGQAHFCLLVVGQFPNAGGVLAFDNSDNSMTLQVPGSGWVTAQFGADGGKSVGSPDGNPHVIDICFDSGTLGVTVDGANVGTQSFAETTVPLFNSVTGGGFPTKFDLGFFNNYPIYNAGVIGDILLTTSTSAPTAAQRNAIEQVYGTHYGLNIAAPSDPSASSNGAGGPAMAMTNATYDTASPKFGTAALSGGTGSAQLTMAANSSYTIETWVRSATSVTSGNALFGSATGAPAVVVGGDGKLAVFAGNTQTGGGPVLADGAWHQIVETCDGTTGWAWVDGTPVYNGFSGCGFGANPTLQVTSSGGTAAFGPGGAYGNVSGLFEIDRTSVFSGVNYAGGQAFTPDTTTAYTSATPNLKASWNFDGSGASQ